MPASYPSELRQRAIGLVQQQGRPVVEVAKGLRISESTLRKWLRPADADESSDASVTAKRKKDGMRHKAKPRENVRNEDTASGSVSLPRERPETVEPAAAPHAKDSSLRFSLGARAEYDRRAKRLGFVDIVDLLAANRELSNGDIGRLVGVGPKTVSRIRKRYAPQLVPSHRQQAGKLISVAFAASSMRQYDSIAKGLGYPNVQTLIGDSQALSHVELGSKLGVTPKAAARLRRRLAVGVDSTPMAQPSKGQRHDYSTLAQQHGFPNMPALLDGAVRMSTKQLAEWLQIGYATAWRLRHGRPRGRRLTRLGKD